MKWDDLKVFLAVARAESLSGAAKSLRLDPATVGRRIARLEQDLGRSLFLKSPQGYQLTPPGTALLARAETAETAIIGAQDVAGEAEALTGQIRIGAPDGCANYVLPQVCAGLCRDYPGLELQIVALPRVFNLSKREADMAVTVSQPSTGRLTSQRLTDYHLSLMASESYLDQALPLISLDDLKHHQVIGYISDLIFDAELDYLSELGAPKVSLSSNSVSVQINAARGGAGVVIGHDFSLPFAPELVRVLPKEFNLKRSFYLVRHADDRGIGRLDRFVSELVPRIRQEVARLEGQERQT